MADRPRWHIAPYLIIDDVVATAGYYRDMLGFSFERFFEARGAKITRAPCTQPYGYRDFDVEYLNGYRLCFGHDVQAS